MSHHGIGKISLASRAETPMMPLQREVEPKTATQLCQEGVSIKAELENMRSRLRQWEAEATELMDSVGGVDSPDATPEIKALYALYGEMYFASELARE